MRFDPLDQDDDKLLPKSKISKFANAVLYVVVGVWSIAALTLAIVFCLK